jgi:hypothetical protein
VLEKPALAGDIAYWDGSKVKTVSQDKWDASLGTPVGVVVVPTGFAPDGKARMLSLYWVNSLGQSTTNSSVYVKWDNSSNKVDTSLVNYTKVPLTDNAGSTTTGTSYYGKLPSDHDSFLGNTSYVDPITKYDVPQQYTTIQMVPSPYLVIDGVERPNPAYYAEISGYNNALADFDGKGNTDVLVALGANYVAANAARNYKVTGAEEIEWYLPAVGELGYIMPRLNKIQNALTKLDAALLALNFSI